MDAENDYISFYDSSEHIRNNYLQLIISSIYIDCSYEKIANFFENAHNLLLNKSSYAEEVIAIRIHEMFIYTIAYFWKYENYNAIGYLLKRTYFNKNRLRSTNEYINNYHMFYSGTYHLNLDNAVNKRDNKDCKKKYYTGTGQHWINTLANELCSKEQFVLADLICFNYSYFGNNSINDYWPWFPITYVYDNEFDSTLAEIGNKLISKEFTEKASILFGYSSSIDFISQFKIAIEVINSKHERARYNSCFVSAHVLSDFIQVDKIASLN